MADAVLSDAPFLVSLLGLSLSLLRLSPHRLYQCDGGIDVSSSPHHGESML